MTGEEEETHHDDSSSSGVGETARGDNNSSTMNVDSGATADSDDGEHEMDE